MDRWMLPWKHLFVIFDHYSLSCGLLNDVKSSKQRAFPQAKPRKCVEHLTVHCYLMQYLFSKTEHHKARILILSPCLVFLEFHCPSYKNNRQNKTKPSSTAPNFSISFGYLVE